jgi:hypothetical protein
MIYSIPYAQTYQMRSVETAQDTVNAENDAYVASFRRLYTHDPVHWRNAAATPKHELKLVFADHSATHDDLYVCPPIRIRLRPSVTCAGSVRSSCLRRISPRPFRTRFCLQIGVPLCMRCAKRQKSATDDHAHISGSNRYLTGVSRICTMCTHELDSDSRSVNLCLPGE